MVVLQAVLVFFTASLGFWWLLPQCLASPSFEAEPLFCLRAGKTESPQRWLPALNSLHGLFGGQIQNTGSCTHTHTKTLETRVCVYVSLRLFKECPEGAREPVAKGVKKQYLDDKWQTKITRGTACSNSKVKGPHCPEPWASCSGE